MSNYHFLIRHVTSANVPTITDVLNAINCSIRHKTIVHNQYFDRGGASDYQLLTNFPIT